MSITVSEGATVAFNRAQLAQMFAHAPGFMALLVGPEHRFELTNPNSVSYTHLTLPTILLV